MPAKNEAPQAKTCGLLGRNTEAASPIRLIKIWLPVAASMGMIFYFSSLPGNTIKPYFPLQDILFHVSAYLLLSLFFARALRNTYIDIIPARLILYTVLFAVFYAVTDEWHQSFVPYRSVSGMDLFFDGVGGLAGSLSYRWPK